MKDFNEWFSKRLRNLRQAEGMTQGEFAEQCGIGKATYERLEREEYTPRLCTCLLISKALNISISSLFEGYESEIK